MERVNRRLIVRVLHLLLLLHRLLLLVSEWVHRWVGVCHLSLLLSLHAHLILLLVDLLLLEGSHSRLLVLLLHHWGTSILVNRGLAQRGLQMTHRRLHGGLHAIVLHIRVHHHHAAMRVAGHTASAI